MCSAQVLNKVDLATAEELAGVSAALSELNASAPQLRTTNALLGVESLLNLAAYSSERNLAPRSVDGRHEGHGTAPRASSQAEHGPRTRRVDPRGAPAAG